METKKFYGSINITRLLEAIHEKHSAFVRAGEKKQVFGNVTLWVNEEPDKYGNLLSLQLNPAKDSGDKAVYIANLKPSQNHIEGLSGKDLVNIPTDDELPF